VKFLSIILLLLSIPLAASSTQAQARAGAIDTLYQCENQQIEAAVTKKIVTIPNKTGEIFSPSEIKYLINNSQVKKPLLGIKAALTNLLPPRTRAISDSSINQVIDGEVRTVGRQSSYMESKVDYILVFLWFLSPCCCLAIYVKKSQGDWKKFVISVVKLLVATATTIFIITIFGTQLGGIITLAIGATLLMMPPHILKGVVGIIILQVSIFGGAFFLISEVMEVNIWLYLIILAVMCLIALAIILIAKIIKPEVAVT
jgi:hypothetical protein